MLFELFQNADDAVAELQLAADSDSADESLSHVVAIELLSDALIFAHWGRAINQMRFETDRQVGIGHEHDLPKMLMLQTSDKPASHEGVPLTGKFGLGFKTVYLVCDRPQILSGRLSFDIIGGMYPRRLVEAYDTMQRIRAKYVDGRQKTDMGTLFYLPAQAATEQRSAAEEAFDAFQSLGQVAVVFARHISRIEIPSSAGKNTVVSWSPRNISECPNIQIGSLRSEELVGSTDSMQGLLLHDDDCSMLLGIGTRFQKTAQTNSNDLGHRPHA